MYTVRAKATKMHIAIQKTRSFFLCFKKREESNMPKTAKISKTAATQSSINISSLICPEKGGIFCDNINYAPHIPQ